MRLQPIEKITVWVVKGGLLAVTLLPLYISSGMLFPFITGKNFFFRMIIEVVFVLWTGLAIVRPEFRPRLTLLFKAATIFISVLFLADLFSPNPSRAFFSNYERMEGFMMLFHLYLYFVLLTSVFKTKKDWLLFFHVSLGVSIIVGFVGLLQKFGLLEVSRQGGYRVDSTIGNPAYLAAYLLFHVWFLVILLRTFWEKWWLRIIYAAVLVFELLIIYFTATRGASLALFLGVLLMLIFSIVFWRKLFPGTSVGYRKLACAVLGLVILLPIAFWQVRHASWIPQNSAFSRLASISLQDRTTQSRFSIWQMSLQGAMERPFLGWGQENYYLVFQKYFDPKLYASEPWFDRSHNIFFDWLVHAGFFGLLSFLFMIGAALWGIGKGLKTGAIPVWEGTLLFTIFATHFFQNIFVFDNLNTYLLFFAALAYAELQLRGGAPVPAAVASVAAVKKPGKAPIAYTVSAGFLLLVVIFGYSLHIKPMRASGFIIHGLLLNQLKAPLPQVQAAFKSAIDLNTFGTTEAREQLGNTARNIVSDANYPEEDRKQFVTFAIEELRKELARPAKDVKHMIFLASVLDRAVGFNPDYILEAESLMKDAIAMAPRKQMLYFELTQVYLVQGKTAQALETLQKAFELERSYPQASVNLAVIGQATGHPEIVGQVKPYIKPEALDEELLVRIGAVYQQAQDFAAAKDVFARLIEVAPKNAGYQATAAALFANAGEYERAIRAAETAASLDASLAKEVEGFIQFVRNKMQQK